MSNNFWNVKSLQIRKYFFQKIRNARGLSKLNLHHTSHRLLSWCCPRIKFFLQKWVIHRWEITLTSLSEIKARSTREPLPDTNGCVHGASTLRSSPCPRSSADTCGGAWGARAAGGSGPARLCHFIQVTISAGCWQVESNLCGDTCKRPSFITVV